MRRIQMRSGIFRVFVLIACFARLLSIAGAHVRLDEPVGGETFFGFELVEVQWNAYIYHGPGTIMLELSLDGGESYSTVVSDLPLLSEEETVGTYTWTVPAVDSEQCIMRVTYEYGTPTIYTDVSGEFTIHTDPAIEELVLVESPGEYEGVRDNTIYEEYNRTNGGGSHLFIGKNVRGFRNRLLIEFDITEIPQGSTVISTELQLTVSDAIAAAEPSSLHLLNVDWGEGEQDAQDDESYGAEPADGDATWVSNFHNISNWSSVGASGDYEEVASATADVGAEEESVVWTSQAMVQKVQEWLDGLHDNYGWILIGNESEITTAKRFYSSDNTSVLSDKRPRLTIRFIPPPLEPKDVKQWGGY